jgi:hypothetical protein
MDCTVKRRKEVNRGFIFQLEQELWAWSSSLLPCSPHKISFGNLLPSHYAARRSAEWADGLTWQVNVRQTMKFMCEK